MKIAIVGLGKMGYQIVEKLQQNGHEVLAFDENTEQITKINALGAIGLTSRQEVVTHFGKEKAVVWLMIPASAVDEEIARWQEILSPGSIIIDGGNSDFRADKDRSDRLLASSIQFVDVGVSGGILGKENGFSMMIGGSAESVDFVTPVFISLSKPKGAYHYFGASGSGHFVKMVHNAIEYGYMESLAEGYRLLHEGPIANLDLAAISDVWQHASIIESSLNSLARDIFSENPDLNSIQGSVVESGEVGWALDVAKERKIDMPSIQSASNVRIASQRGEVSFATKLLAALRNKFGGHNLNGQ